MRPTWFILGLLLLAPLAAAQEPNHRDDLTLDHAVRAVAISEDGSRLFVGVEDDGSASSPLEDKDQNTWAIYEILADAYNLRQEGGADPSDCDESLVIGESCSSDVVLIAASTDGSRGAVVSHSSGTTSEVLLVEARGAQKHHVQIEGVVTSLDIDALGETIVVGVDGSGVTAADSGIHVWHWDTSFSTWDKTTEDPVTAVDVSDDGARIVAVAGSQTVIYGADESSSALKDGWAPRSVTAAAVSSHKDHVTVAGGDRGAIRVYEEDSNGKMRRELNIPGNQVAVTAMAIKDDGSQMAAGYEDGRLVVWSLDNAPVNLGTRHVNEDIGAAIGSLEYSADGSHLLIGYDDRIRLWAAQEPVQELWNQTLPASITGTAIDGSGEHIAVTFGSKLRLYEAVHDIAIAAAWPAVVQPGVNQSYLVTMENTGDRRAAGTLAVDAPDAWGVWIDQEAISLLPGEKATVNVAFDIPFGAPPGEEELVFELPTDANTYSSTKSITVPTVEKWNLTRNGSPTSLPIEGGQPAEFTLKIRNEGNVEKKPPISISVGPNGWTAQIVAGDGALSPGQARDLRITLKAPSGAAQLDQGKAIVTVEGDDPIELIGTVGAIFGVEIVAPGGITVMGNGSTFSVTVRNTGNAPDSYRLEWGSVPNGWSIGFGASSTTTVTDVPAGGQKTVQARIDPAVGASGPPLAVGLEATSLADSSVTDSANFQFSLSSETSTTTTKKKDDGGIPGPGPVLLLGGLAVALALARRRW